MATLIIYPIYQPDALYNQLTLGDVLDHNVYVVQWLNRWARTLEVRGSMPGFFLLKILFKIISKMYKVWPLY